MKKIFVLIFLVSIASSFSQSKIKDYNPTSYSEIFKEPDSIFIEKPKKIETAYKGFKYPYIHINGYHGSSIKKSNYKNFKTFFELKFYHTYSSFYTRKVMYEIFGNWNSYFSVKHQNTPFLIWKNIKLFKDDDRKFTVIAGGYECSTCKSDNDRIYSSIFLLDQNGNDLLLDQNSELVKKTMQFFSEGIKNLTNSNEFYNKFWKLAKKY